MFIYLLCKIYISKWCKLWCDDCDLFFCFFCLLLFVYEWYKYFNIFEVYRFKKELIKNDVEKIENKVLLVCEEMEKDIEVYIFNIDEVFERVILVVENYGKYWYKKIDFILREMKDNIG